MAPVPAGELWVEGTADSQQMAVADAISNAPEIPPSRPGARLVINVDAVWQDNDGKTHAKIYFQEIPDPDAGDNIAKVPHDHLTEPESEADEALHNTPDMEHAEEVIEEDFDLAAHEQQKQRVSELEPQPRQTRTEKLEPVPDGTEEKEEK